MKFSTKGIGWLIFGALVCFSATESYDLPGIASSIALGLVFIAIYLMKQKFNPRGLGWFIVGGILLAFCLDQFLSIVGGFASRLSVLPDELSDLLIGFILAAGCMFMFYRRNKAAIDDVADDIGAGEFEFPYQQEVFKEDIVEETVHTVEETVTGDGTKTVITPHDGVMPGDGASGTDDSVVEIEVTDGK